MYHTETPGETRKMIGFNEALDTIKRNSVNRWMYIAIIYIIVELSNEESILFTDFTEITFGRIRGFNRITRHTFESFQLV